MTKEDWKIVENKWGYAFMNVELMVDGTLVTLQTVRSKMKLSVMVYVDNRFLGKWTNKCENGEWHDYAKRFFMHRYISKCSTKELKRMERAFGKKWCKKNGLYEKVEYVTPYWTSFNSFKRHLIANNKDIKLVA